MVVFIPRRARLGRYRQIATTAARHGLGFIVAQLGHQGRVLAGRLADFRGILPRLESATLAARGGVRRRRSLSPPGVASLLGLAAACGGGEQQVSGPRLLLKGDTFDLGSVPPGEERPVGGPFENGGAGAPSVGS